MHDQVMGEYAAVTAAISLLASSLTGAFGSALSSSDAKTAGLVASLARAHHLSATEADVAYKHAPYGRPALRYLYALGWLSAQSNPTFCKLEQALGGDPANATAQSLRTSPKIVAVLRSAHITVSSAAAAIGRGTTDGCA
jgi:hypothetical protein